MNLHSGASSFISFQTLSNLWLPIIFWRDFLHLKIFSFYESQLSKIEVKFPISLETIMSACHLCSSNHIQIQFQFRIEQCKETKFNYHCCEAFNGRNGISTRFNSNCIKGKLYILISIKGNSFLSGHFCDSFWVLNFSQEQWFSKCGWGQEWPGNLLKVHILRPHPRPSIRNSGYRDQKCVLTRPLDSQ